MKSNMEMVAKASEQAAERISHLSPAKRSLLELRLKKAMDEKRVKGAIPSRKEKDPAPLSFAQQRLWFLHQLNPESPHYNIYAAWRLKGLLNADALHRALNDIVGRHETLRTTFSLSNGEPVQVVATGLLLDFPITDLSNCPPHRLESEIQRLTEEEVRRPFDLARGPLLRCALIRLDAAEHLLLLTMHHIISDGWSMGLLFHELGVLYENHITDRASTLPALPVQYADYSQWQRRWLQGEVLEKQLHYWKSQLAGVSPLLELPIDHPRPKSQRFRGARHTFNLSLQLIERLKLQSHTEGATLFMTLLAAFQLFLHRFTGQEDIVVGAPIAGRTRSEVENLIGFFVNTLVFRTDLSGNPTFRELLKRVREITLNAYDHQDLPFEKLVEELHPKRDLSYNPIFQVTFAFQNMPKTNLQLGGLSVSPEEVDIGLSQFDMSLFFNETNDGMQVRLVYNTDLFERPTIERMAGHYHTLLEGISASPDLCIGSLPILTREERQYLLVSLNDTRRDYQRDKCLHHLFEDQASRTPENIAAQFENQTLTYQELNERANRVAHYLGKRGVGPDVLVGILMERSLEMVIGLLGILKAGGAYVPLDPSYPADRLEFMLEDARAQILLTQQGLHQKPTDYNGHILCLDSEWETLAGEALENPGIALHEDHLAYVIYTSGSTGRPKGVMIPHQAICNHMLWMIETFSLTEADRVLQKTPFSFDASIWEFYAPLLVGGRLVMARPGGHQDGEYLIDTIAERQITTLQLVPSLLRMLLELGGLEKCTSLRQVFCGGEVLTIELQEGLFNCSRARLYNLYGPTETAIDATWWACRQNDEYRTVPIGHPIANVQTYVLDASLQPVPIGASGELHIGGEGLARGYLNLSELTEGKFIRDPFRAEPHARMYKTGDLVRRLPDGALEFLGRIDQQVKFRGFRIEPGEIETQLQRHPAINSAVVILLEDMPGEKRIAAYVTGRKGESIEIRDVRQFLAQNLPEYMIPSIFMILDTLPLLPNGKVNRKALPAPGCDSVISPVAFNPPRTPVETAISDIWRNVLGVAQMGIHSNFFEVGGHSLLAIRVVSRINAAYQVKLSVRSLFEAPTIAEFAEKIQSARMAGGAAAEEPSPCTNSPAKHCPDKKISPLQSRTGRYPLSYAQQRLWFLNRIDPESPYYNVPIARRFKGELHVDAMQAALNGIAMRHEVLRTTFDMREGEPMQVVAPSIFIDLPVTDLSLHEPEVREEILKRLCTEDAHRGFDLEKGPLLRCFLYRLGQAEHVLLLSMHHIITDEWSMEVFDRELWALYEAFSRGEPSSLSALPIQYADYAVWQRECLKNDELEKQLKYWKERLAGMPPVLELPTDHPRPEAQRSGGGNCTAVLPVEVLEDLRTLSRAAGGTLFMTLLSAFQLLLHHYSGQEDIAVGSPITGRTCSELEGLIGFFVNTLVLRTDFGGNPSFKELLGRVREVTLGAFEHQELPFEKLVEELRPERSLSYNPLIQVVFVLQTTQAESSRKSQLTVSPEQIDSKSAKFDITLFVAETPQGLGISLGYNTDLFDRQTIERMVAYFRTLLQEIASNPDRRLSDIPWFSEFEYHQIVHEWNRTCSGYPKDLCVHQVFEQQVAATPDSVALVFGRDRFTYAQLNARADQLARFLHARGIGPEKRVGICFERSPEMIVGMLGILKAGGAYVPLDPAYPSERLSFMVADAQIEVLLTQQKLRDQFPYFTGPVIALDGDQESIDRESTKNPDHTDSSDQLAYVMYTSGSTGKPKGVAVVHRGIVRLVRETNYIKLTSDEVILQFAPISFDAATFEIWGALLNGARLVIFPDHLPSLKELADVLKQYRISTLWLTAGLFHQMVANHLEGLKPVRQLLAGGDVLSPPLVKKALEALPECRLINGYGPTENTTFTCCHVMTDPGQVGNAVPIGRPIANTQVYILDTHLKPVPIGVAGELFIGGDGLARGYLNRPELNREKFIPDSFSADPAARLYRSGDLARYREDGVIEFLGRKDTQVKLRGFRIELGEIEAILAGHPAVRETTTAVLEDISGSKQLIAYVVQKQGQRTDAEALRTFLRGKVPEYMVPAAFVWLDNLPLTSNGKVDRKALPAPDQGKLTTGRKYRAPRNALEVQLVKLWEKSLNVRPIGTRDNFFELGGHSLMAVQMVAQIRKHTGKEISIADLFRHPTIRQLSQAMQSQGWSSPFSLLLPFQPTGPLSPFYCIHGAGREITEHIGLEQPYYSGLPHGLDGKRIPSTVEEMAVDYVKEIRLIQPEGPYYLGGYSFGGMLAFEIAYQLKGQGQEIGLLALIDATSKNDEESPSTSCQQCNLDEEKGESVLSRMHRIGRKLVQMKSAEKFTCCFKILYRLLIKRTGLEKKFKIAICEGCLAAGLSIPSRFRAFYRYDWKFRQAIRSYHPRQKYNGPTVLFCAEKSSSDFLRFWKKMIGTEPEIHRLPGGHHDLFKEPQVSVLARKLRLCLSTAQHHQAKE